MEFSSRKWSAADHPGLPKILSPVLRGHVHHRRAAALFVSSGKFFVEMAQAIITMWPGTRFHRCSSVPLRNLGRNSKCFGQLAKCCNQPRRRDMLPSTMVQPEVIAAPSKLPPPPGPVWKQPSEDSDASGEDELEQSFQSFKSEEMTTSSSSAEGMKNQDVTEYLREQARQPPQSHARDPAHHATRVRCHRTDSCRSQSSQRSWRASCPT